MTVASRVKSTVGIIFLMTMILWLVAMYWSQESDLFLVKDVGIAEAESLNKKVVTGTMTTATVMHEINTLLDKSGGFLSNDIMPPSIFMDDIPNWEYGVLVQVRDMIRAMRDSISRSQSQSTEDTDLAIAEQKMNIAHTDWALPNAQDEYTLAVRHLRKYLDRLSSADEKDAQFFARADNLHYWLSTVEARLGSLSQRLSASVGQKRINTDLAGDSAATQSTPRESEFVIKTPWLKIDDVFYEARGTAWALLHLLHAIEIDFADVLAKKNANVSVAQIIRELEATQQSLFSPMILNGSGFGFWANHSLVMASYISRANAGVIDLRKLLENG